MTVEQFLREATAKFTAAGITSARLDAQVLLCRALNQNKAWLLAHGQETIDDQKLSTLLEQVRRRAARQPLAYIVGFQEFYGRRFKVNPNALIPRPETEQLIEDLRALPLPDNAAVLDVGTGSGSIAITAALELPHLRVQACDISPEALELAQENAERLGIPELPFFVSDLLAEAHQTYDAILANLPYVARDWQRSPETNFEPQLALFAEDDGLEFIKQLVGQAPAKLNKKGYLLLEADPRQHAAVQKLASSHGFKHISTNDFIICFLYL